MSRFEASSIRMNRSRPARSPLAGTHSVTFRRSLPWVTAMSCWLSSGMRLSFGTLAVTVILTGTLAAASCAFDGATVIIAAAIVTAAQNILILDFIVFLFSFRFSSLDRVSPVGNAPSVPNGN